MADSIRALSWNVNGIRAAHKKGFIDKLGRLDPDIICLQETKAHPDQLPAALKEIDGYSSFFSTPERKGYSGVGLYTKIEPDNVSFGLGVEEYDKEGRVLVADYGRFVLINIYFPNGQSSKERLDYKMAFYKHFLEFVEKIKASGKGIVLCGDLNTAHTEIDLARPKENSPHDWWYYGTAKVIFDANCRVEGWDNKKDVLKISDNTACSTSTFGLGSTKDEVREVQGKPTKIVHREGTSGFLPIEREWMDKFISHGYKDTFRMVNQEPENYTYWDQITKARDRNVGWRIDYFFVDNAFADQVAGAFILADVMDSDHCPVGIDIRIN